MAGFSDIINSYTGASSAGSAGSALPGLAGASAGGLGGLGLMGVGMIGQGIAAYGGYEAAKGEAQVSSNIAALEKQANQVKWNQTQLNFNRSRLQELRNAQQGRSMVLANATGSGAQLGSAVGGGLGNIGGQEGTTMVSLSQNEQNAQQEYNINQSISDQEIQGAKYKGEAAMWSGIGSLFGGASSLGGNIAKSSTNPSGSIFG